MTQVAIQGGRDMILRLTPGRHTMTALAIIHDTRVIESRTSESADGMANTAILIGNNVPARLAIGKYTVVTRLTVVNDSNVSKRRGFETARYVALTAICIGRYVIALLAKGNTTVMA